MPPGVPKHFYHSYELTYRCSCYHFQHHKFASLQATRSPIVDKLSGIGVGAALAANERDHAESEASPCGYRATLIRSFAARDV